MKVLVFDVSGRYAHFRKYYTNSSSLTYLVPPRTTLCGLAAGILGIERDAYYDQFVPGKVDIGVQILKPARKIMQTVNYMKIEGPKDFIQPKNHTQIPFEILTGDDGVAYRIYFSSNQAEIMDRMTESVREGWSWYPPYLGSAPFQCSLTYVCDTEADYGVKDGRIRVSSLVRVESIKEKTLDILSEPVSLYREKMPRYFDNGRTLHETASYLYDVNGKALKMEVKEPVLSLEICNEQVCVTFM